MAGRKARRFAPLLRGVRATRPRRVPRRVLRVALPLAVLFVLLLVVVLSPRPLTGAPRSDAPVEEKVPPPDEPLDGPPPRDVRLFDARNDTIDAAQPLVDDHGVDRLSVVPVDAVSAHDHLPPLSVIVLFHNEYDTLNHTLHTWLKNDLVSHVAELVFFLNGVPSKDQFYQRLPLLEHAPWTAVTRVELSTDNMKLGLAIRRMVQLASHDYVLLMEKDWALIETPAQVVHQLSVGVSLLNSSTAHVVRYRHRTHPGAPLHARIMHENREQQMLDQQSNLYCYIHHWVKNPTERYGQYFTRCDGTDQVDEVWCSPAKYCQWTNNPALFKRNWFLEELGDRFAEDYKNTVRTNPNSNMLDFEFYTNWNATIWNDRQFVVALPFGLFEHNEVGEQNLMNTVWYAWNRLHTDAEEKRKELLAVEREQCDEANKSMSSGATFAERYPIEFVRMYHYEEAMTKNTSLALGNLSQEVQRVRTQLEEGHGSWRNGITDLTNFYYTIALYTYPMEPVDMKIGFVLALFRTDDDDDAFEDAVDAVVANLEALRLYDLVLYCDEESRTLVVERLKEKFEWKEADLERVVLVEEQFDTMVQRVLGKANYDRIEKLYADVRWQNLYKMRSRGVLKSVKGVMLDICKVLILDDCVGRSEGEGVDARLREVTHFVWLDARSRCFGSDDETGAKQLRRLIPGVNDAVFRANMMLKCLVTARKASSLDELEEALFESGMKSDQVLGEMRKSVTDGVAVTDLKMFGGGKVCVRLMKGYYDVVLTDALRRGLLGNGRVIMSVGVDNVAYHFNVFDGDWRCAQGCARCNYMRERCDGGCGLLRWSGECGRG